MTSHSYTPDRPLRLGTRGSPLALAQARMTAQALCARQGWVTDAIATVVVQTSGDRIQDRALAEIGGKALWTKELDRALLEGQIDFAVHSMKDVETIRPAEITIAALLPERCMRHCWQRLGSIDWGSRMSGHASRLTSCCQPHRRARSASRR